MLVFNWEQYRTVSTGSIMLRDCSSLPPCHLPVPAERWHYTVDVLYCTVCATRMYVSSAHYGCILYLLKGPVWPEVGQRAYTKVVTCITDVFARLPIVLNRLRVSATVCQRRCPTLPSHPLCHHESRSVPTARPPSKMHKAWCCTTQPCIHVLIDALERG